MLTDVAYLVITGARAESKVMPTESALSCRTLLYLENVCLFSNIKFQTITSVSFLSI